MRTCYVYLRQVFRYAIAIQYVEHIQYSSHSHFPVWSTCSNQACLHMHSYRTAAARNPSGISSWVHIAISLRHTGYLNFYRALCICQIFPCLCRIWSCWWARPGRDGRARESPCSRQTRQWGARARVIIRWGRTWLILGGQALKGRQADIWSFTCFCFHKRCVATTNGKCRGTNSAAERRGWTGSGGSSLN